jgi:hypothetical protein
MPQAPQVHDGLAAHGPRFGVEILHYSASEP